MGTRVCVKQFSIDSHGLRFVKCPNFCLFILILRSYKIKSDLMPLSSASEFEDRYFSYPTYDVISKSYDFYAHQCYDHVWVAAKALDCTVTRLVELGEL